MGSSSATSAAIGDESQLRLPSGGVGIRRSSRCRIMSMMRAPNPANRAPIALRNEPRGARLGRAADAEGAAAAAVDPVAPAGTSAVVVAGDVPVRTAVDSPVLAGSLVG